MTTKPEIKEFLNNWLEKPFPKKTRGDNIGDDKWHIIPSKISKHLLLVKTTENEFLLKVINEGYKGILTASYDDLESLGTLFSEANMKELKRYLEVSNEFGSNGNSQSIKTNSII